MDSGAAYDDDSMDMKGQKTEPMVKQENMERDINTNSREIKKEPQQEDAQDEEHTGRSMRKRKVNSMAEISDHSEESGDENRSKPPPKKRGASVGKSRGRPKKTADLPANQADPSRSPRIVLKNIGSDEIQSTGKKIKADLNNSQQSGRGRGRRTSTPRSAAKGGAKAKKPAKVDTDEEEEEELEEEDLDDDVDDDEDFVPKKPKAGRASKQAFRARGKGKGKTGKAKHDEENEDEEEEGEEDEDGVADAAGESAESNPNAVKTGQYLIEKSDMRRLENYPIWRMEGPNMLRKFEMFVHEGIVRHKSLYAYSSWAQSMQDLFEKIQVRQISSQDGESIVEITPEHLPKPPDMDSLVAKYSNDDLLHVYNICVEAMFRQAVDPSFLKKIKDMNDSHYISALNHLDTIIRDKISSIESEVSMKDDFKTRMRNCPNMKSIRRQNWSQTDQATTNKSTEKGVRSVLLFGFGYDPFFMEEDKSKGVEVAQEVVIGNTMERYLAAYHGLIHFRYTLLRRCQDKIKLTMGLDAGLDLNSILDKCLHDTVWILQTFEDLKNLLAN